MHKLVSGLETVLIFALGLGIFISKPVIYAASGALVAWRFFVWRSIRNTDPSFSQQD